MGCNYRDFCSRHRDYILSELDSPKTENAYTLDVSSIVFDQEKITATLMGAGHEDPLVSELKLNLWLYEDGIARVTIDEPESDRFRISEQPILTEGINLKPVVMIKDFFSYTEDGFNIEGVT